MNEKNTQKALSSKTLWQLLEEDAVELPEKISDTLPKMQPIPPKAMFFDLAASNLSFPDLSEKVQKQGLFKKAWSFFGR